MVGTSAQKIISVFNNLVKDEVLYRKMSQTSNPYGDGTAARQIAGILLKEQPSNADRQKKVLNV